jgi:hypothetical protein
MNKLKIYDLEYWCKHIEFKACNIIEFNLSFIKIRIILSKINLKMGRGKRRKRCRYCYAKIFP